MTLMKFPCTGWRRLAMAAVCGCLMTRAVPAQSAQSGQSAQSSQSLEIIELEHRTAQEVIPVLQPLLESGGALSGTDYTLFVRASAGNVAQLRQALAQIDRQPRQLLVSVRRATQQDLRNEGVGAVVGSSGAVGNGRPGVTVHATDTAAQRDNAGVASVQVLEGSQAYIAIGQSVPVVTAVVGGGGRRPWIGSSISHRDLASGFLVTPRISGEQVTLDISQQAQQRSTHSGGIETQQLSTQVSARLGEWMQLGGVSESADARRSDILAHRYATRSDERSIWVKVEER